MERKPNDWMISPSQNLLSIFAPNIISFGDIVHHFRDYWANRLGPDFQIVVAHIIPELPLDNNEDMGLGISLEGTVNIVVSNFYIYALFKNDCIETN